MHYIHPRSLSLLVPLLSNLLLCFLKLVTSQYRTCSSYIYWQYTCIGVHVLPVSISFFHFDSNGSNEMGLYEDDLWIFLYNFGSIIISASFHVLGKCWILNIALNNIVMNLIALLGSPLTISPLVRPNPGVLFVLVVDISFFFIFIRLDSFAHCAYLFFSLDVIIVYCSFFRDNIWQKSLSVMLCKGQNLLGRSSSPRGVQFFYCWSRNYRSFILLAVFHGE